jgi:poly(hydroxyalkanoate) depolymerase family esterase
MDSSFQRRLMRAARLSGMARLSDSASVVQRALARAVPRKLMPSLGRSSDGLMAGLDALARFAPGARPAAPVPETAEPPWPPSAEFRSETFQSPAGTRPYRLFVPSRPLPRPPLLVMLHGCTQTAEDFALGTRMNALAQARGWLVLYPVQLSSANAQRCWNWFQAQDQQRGHGEPALIADMTRAVIQDFNVSPTAVFAAGLSAGGAEAALLGALYPDLFTAIGVHSGLACGAAGDIGSAFMAMRSGRPGSGRHSMPAIVFHGDRDNTVNPRNADALVAQFATGPALRTEHGEIPGGRSYDRTLYPGASGARPAELWMVQGLGHAWSGGSEAGSYTDPAGPDASGEMLRYFAEVAHLA